MVDSSEHLEPTTLDRREQGPHRLCVTGCAPLTDHAPPSRPIPPLVAHGISAQTTFPLAVASTPQRVASTSINPSPCPVRAINLCSGADRSEERRVGKECRSRWS